MVAGGQCFWPPTCKCRYFQGIDFTIINQLEVVPVVILGCILLISNEALKLILVYDCLATSNRIEIKLN